MKTATHPAPTSAPPTGPHNALQAGSEKPIDSSNRITLAVLEEFPARAQGYDPYNTPTAQRSPYSWERKRKRD